MIKIDTVSKFAAVLSISLSLLSAGKVFSSLMVVKDGERPAYQLTNSGVIVLTALGGH